MRFKVGVGLGLGKGSHLVVKRSWRALGGAGMTLLGRLSILHDGWGVLPADLPVVGVAQVDVPGEAVVRVLEARAGLALGEAEAVDGPTVRGVGLGAE